jgi:pepF/M3 family oligoendopeptidase
MSNRIPHWNLKSIFPSLDSPEFKTAFQGVLTGVDTLVALFDQEDVRKKPEVALSDEIVSTLEKVVNAYNAFLEELRTVSVYVHCHIATDSRNELAQAKQSEMSMKLVALNKLSARFTAWIGCLPVEEVIAKSTIAQDHAYLLRQAKELSRKQMSPDEEALAADLGVTGGSSWSRLHGNVTSILQATVNGENMPVSMIRTLAYEADRSLRQAAYEAEIAAWKTAEVPLAAAMNSIKGEVNTLAKRRGWDSPLDDALFNANIDRQTLDAMMAAAKDSYPVFRRYMSAKARALGLTKLCWCDMFAPLSADEREWPYEEATSFVAKQFSSFSTKMGDFAQRAFKENWIDAEPRLGKRDGAFCTPVRKDESRVMMNFKPAYGSVTTLAHELGHGYHNLCLANRTSLQRSTPMTLAETASIFCETIAKQAALKEADAGEKLAILEASLQGSCQVVVDISSRFIFEQSVFEKRRDRELSASELCALMVDAQQQTYGEGLEASSLHPYMWAMKPHYYSSGRSYYNFPYMFGLLFGLGLYAEFEKSPETFKSGYDDLLSSTGLYDAATLAARFGIDIRDKAFWAASLATIGRDIEEFERLV